MGMFGASKRERDKHVVQLDTFRPSQGIVPKHIEGHLVLPTVIVYDRGATATNFIDEVHHYSRKRREAAYHHFIVRGRTRFAFGEHMRVIDRYKLL